MLVQTGGYHQYLVDQTVVHLSKTIPLVSHSVNLSRVWIMLSSTWERYIFEGLCSLWLLGSSILITLHVKCTILKPPSVLRPSETHSDQETIEIAVTKLLLRSYYDIVRKNIEDSVPKAIMHFLVIMISWFSVLNSFCIDILTSLAFNRHMLIIWRIF